MVDKGERKKLLYDTMMTFHVNQIKARQHLQNFKSKFAVFKLLDLIFKDPGNDSVLVDRSISHMVCVTQLTYH